MALYSGQYLDETETPVTTTSLRRTKTKRMLVTLLVFGAIVGVGYLVWKVIL